MDEPELKIIDVFICKLRKKIKKAVQASMGLTSDKEMPDLERNGYVETVWGRGYVLRDPDEAEMDLKKSA